MRRSALYVLSISVLTLFGTIGFQNCSQPTQFGALGDGIAEKASGSTSQIDDNARPENVDSIPEIVDPANDSQSSRQVSGEEETGCETCEAALPDSASTSSDTPSLSDARPSSGEVEVEIEVEGDSDSDSDDMVNDGNKDIPIVKCPSVEGEEQESNCAVICHKTDRNPQTLVIPLVAASRHLEMHEDIPGSCEESGLK